MKDKDLKRIIQDDLESKFHLIEEGEEAKKGLTFTHNNKTNSFSKKRYALLTSICIVISIICSSLTSILVYKSVKKQDEINDSYIDRYEAIEYALKEVEKQCDDYLNYPYVERQLSSSLDILIYKGVKMDNKKKYLYFFQVIVKKPYNSLYLFSFEDECKNNFTYDKIENHKLILIELENNNEIDHLYLTIIENDIETANVTLF